MRNRIILLALSVSVATAVTGCARGYASAPARGFTPEAVTLREVVGSSFKALVDDELVFVDATGAAWRAPKGTLTDGASVPRLALWRTDGRYDDGFLKAAVLHDAHCQAENADRCPAQYRTRPWQDVHRMFYEAALAGGTPPTLARVMYAAVWLGGPRWDDPARSLDHVPDAALRAVFEDCERWIEANDPSFEEVEAWMEKRERLLLDEHTTTSL